jgi:hypothetical protein
MKTIKTSRLTLLANRSLLACLAFLILPGTISSTGGSEADVQIRFVGSLACRECHPEEYENFMTYAKKSSSFQSIEKQMKHLTSAPEECRLRSLSRSRLRTCQDS